MNGWRFLFDVGFLHSTISAETGSNKLITELFSLEHLVLSYPESKQATDLILLEVESHSLQNLMVHRFIRVSVDNLLLKNCFSEKFLVFIQILTHQKCQKGVIIWRLWLAT